MCSCTCKKIIVRDNNHFIETKINLLQFSRVAFAYKCNISKGICINYVFHLTWFNSGQFSYRLIKYFFKWNYTNFNRVYMHYRRKIILRILTVVQYICTTYWVSYWLSAKIYWVDQSHSLRGVAEFVETISHMARLRLSVDSQ